MDRQMARFCFYVHQKEAKLKLADPKFGFHSGFMLLLYSGEPSEFFSGFSKFVFAKATELTNKKGSKYQDNNIHRPSFPAIVRKRETIGAGNNNFIIYHRQAAIITGFF